jgi:hypothetical protein
MKLIFEHMSNQNTKQHQGNEDEYKFDHNPITHVPQTGIYVAHHDDYVQQQQGVGFVFVPPSTMSADDVEHINIALASIYSSLQTNTYNPKTIQHLWNIVNQTAHDSFYDNCKNYVINISSQQSLFLVSPRFDTPLSVKLNAQCTRLFLWAYLTLLESPSIHTQLHIDLPDNGFTVLANGTEQT